MTTNEKYHELIANLENAINNLDDAIFADRVENTEHWRSFQEAHQICKALSYFKCQIMKNLEDAGALKYKIKEEPF